MSGIDLLRNSFAAFNRGDLDASATAMSPDFIANIPGIPEPVRGVDAWKQNASVFRQAFPDLHAEIDDIFAAGDRVAVRLTFRGTHERTFQGVPPTGRGVTFTSIEIYRVEDDLLAEEWVAPDMASLFRQITSSE